MVKTLNLRNFKAFSNMSQMLLPLNVLAGLNGMGKSSFIQALLLLRKGLISQQPFIQPTILDLSKDNLVYFKNIGSIWYDVAPERVVQVSISDENDNILSYEVSVDDIDESQPICHATIAQAFIRKGIGDQYFRYMAADRLGPREYYKSSDVVAQQYNPIGNNGEFAFKLFHDKNDQDIPIIALSHPDLTPNDYKGNPRYDYGTQLNAWLQELSPGISLNTVEDTKDKRVYATYRYERNNNSYSRTFTPDNVGFGISYTIAVLMSLLSAEVGSLVIIENPEAHLHPKAQTILGELMATAAANGVQIVLETHSDHIIYGILIGIRRNYEEQKNPNLLIKRGIAAELVNLLYFEREKYMSETQITRINTTDDGRLKSPPPGFLDQFNQNAKKLIRPW